jgi:cytoskeletal protein CcmA (bactofilin family)
MWNRKREDEPAFKPAVPVPSNADLSREGIPMSTYSNRRPDDIAPRGALIGKSVLIKGQVFAREDLLVDGEVEGNIEMPENRLTIGVNGKVNAGIKAREVVIQGTVRGNIEAGERIEIRREAKLVGDLKTVRIVIEDGAYFKGSVDIIKHEVIKPVARPQTQQTAAPVQEAVAVAAAAPEKSN